MTWHNIVVLATKVLSIAGNQNLIYQYNIKQNLTYLLQRESNIIIRPNYNNFISNSTFQVNFAWTEICLYFERALDPVASAICKINSLLV